MNVVITKIPKELWIEKEKVNFNIFAEKFIEYMQDLEDREKVKEEMKKNEKGFDYSMIRWNYV